MTISHDAFLVLFPVFAAESHGRIDAFLALAELEVSETRWGTLYEKGVYYLTAHEMSIANASSSAMSGSGTVTRKIVGDVELDYATTSSTSQSYYNGTSYGQEYWRLVMQVGMGAVAVGWFETE